MNKTTLFNTAFISGILLLSAGALLQITHHPAGPIFNLIQTVSFLIMVLVLLFRIRKPGQSTPVKRPLNLQLLALLICLRSFNDSLPGGTSWQIILTGVLVLVTLSMVLITLYYSKKKNQILEEGA